MKALLAQRTLVSVVVAAVSGLLVRQWVPWVPSDPVLTLISAHSPVLYRALYASYTVLLFTTPLLLASVTLAFAYIFALGQTSPAEAGQLPPYPPPRDRRELFLVLGEQHHRTKPIPSPTPTWLTVPARGLYTGIAVIGAVGSGKTSGCLYPYAEQVLGYKANDPTARIGGLVLEVKGDFCHDVHRMMQAHKREEDYIEVSLDGPWRYNPLHNDLDAYALAYSIASLINAVFGKGKEPFWQQAYTNLVKFIILLHKTVDDYVTLFDVYTCAIDPERLAAKLAEGETRRTSSGRVTVALDVLERDPRVRACGFELDPTTGQMTARYSSELIAQLDAGGHPYELTDVWDPERAAQLDAVQRWYQHDWQRIDAKLRTSIVEGIAVFLSLFDENQALKRVFCPPKACFDPVLNADGHLGRPLPPFAEVIERGLVCALNFPMAANPSLARIVGTMMKQDFQRAVLGRISQMKTRAEESRAVLLLCDEYHAFATAGEDDPTGDEKFFSLSRQAKCIAIVATQSLSSLKSALPGDTWRTLLQTFRTKVFLTLSDDVSAKVASELVGRTERLVPHYNLAESGQDARISMLTGRSAAHKATVSTSKAYVSQREAVFEPKVFAELKNAQAIVLAYDGLSPLPPTYCYLKPAYLPVQRTYFESLARGDV